MQFRNRTDAGRQLADRLSTYAGRSDVLVLVLPRGDPHALVEQVAVRELSSERLKAKSTCNG